MLMENNIDSKHIKRNLLMEQLLLTAFVFAIALIALCQVVHPHHATQEKLYTAPVKNSAAVIQDPHNTNNAH